jgi:hypothetical protein
MSKIKKIVILLSLTFLISCGKGDSNRPTFELYDTRELMGTWKIVPSYSEKILFEKNDKTFLIKEKEKKQIYALEDARGLRLQYHVEDDSPFAYFLFTEKTKNIWGGILENKVIRIVKEEQIPESILE